MIIINRLTVMYALVLKKLFKLPWQNRRVKGELVVSTMGINSNKCRRPRSGISSIDQFIKKKKCVIDG